MTRRPETVSTHCPLAEVLEVMISGGFRHLPVMQRKVKWWVSSRCATYTSIIGFSSRARSN